MPRDRKINGEIRRQKILDTLKNSQSPITGGELASSTNVSRQVIVSDITLLKAKQEPILATSQGYLFMPQQPQNAKVAKTIVCRHTPEQSEEEMMMIVQGGASIINVSIEHPVYGDLTASMMLHTVTDVKNFMNKINSTDASFLSQLTDGIHLHEIEAESEAILHKIEDTLDEAGILVKD
ncbi:transcription repressor NadR [Jeotgalibacillus campisalis]|uniref:Transcriptional regulator n=1 Tax=Jeotgalibacillus campisalis TaxID=220754 RepID=A0A0C2VQ31_9BACL|nr:transcription repressor NadR [Jeotgalibacillus campisalis]KIL46123.1 transcriptional regulator [Jeotgalibacillus campisalis]